MPDFNYYKHLVRALTSGQIGRYDTTIDAFIKMIKHNLSPKNRIINYDLWLKNIVDKIELQRQVNYCRTDVSALAEKICIINTELYDTGGHTELLVRHLEQNAQQLPIYVYLTNSLLREDDSLRSLNKSIYICSLAKDFYISSRNTKMTDKIFELYNYLIDNKITKVLCNFHMQDAVSAAVLYLIKKHTNIKIEFWNHGDHYYSLGTTFADMIYTRVKDGHALTPYLKNYTNVYDVKFKIDGLVKSYDEQKFIQKREELKIPQDAFITLTGCSLRKVCPKYFKMIHKVLEQNKNIYHIYVCSVDDKEKKRLIKKYKLNERFIIIDFVSDFDFYIQLSDLYIDSFPQGGALTLVDYIKHSKPVVIKINEKEPIRSFEEYLYPNYEYAFKTSKDMLKGIMELAENKEKYSEVSQKVRVFFEETYLLKDKEQ